MTTHIVIPALNASRSLSEVVARIPPGNWRLVVVDDGSRDDTSLVARSIAKSSPYPVSILSHPHRKGYGAAQKTGFRHALKQEATIVALLHSDGQYPPESIPQLVSPIQGSQAHVSAGYLPLDMAGVQGMPHHKRLGNRLLTGLLNRASGAHLNSYHSGFRAYSRRALDSIHFESFSNYYEFDTEMLFAALRRGLSIHEFPIEVKYFKGSSRLNPPLYGGRVLWSILKYKSGGYRP